MKRHLTSLFFLSLPILLLLFAPQARIGASKGLLLWFCQVLPVLFPFSFALQLIVATNALSGINRLIAPLFEKVFHLSPACSFCILSGFLCGFPMGAMTASQFLEKKMIRTDEAQIMSAVCNHASPVFFSGYILDQLLPDHPLRPFLVLIFYLSPCLWLLIRCRMRPVSNVMPFHRHPTSTDTSIATFSFRPMLLSCSELMLKIGVCMMLFSMIQEIIQSLPFMSASSSALLGLFLEITSGCAAISHLAWPEYLKTLWIMGGTAFGGLCISFQSYSLLRSQNLSFMRYLADKSAVGLLTAALVSLLYILH